MGLNVTPAVRRGSDVTDLKPVKVGKVSQKHWFESAALRYGPRRWQSMLRMLLAVEFVCGGLIALTASARLPAIAVAGKGVS